MAGRQKDEREMMKEGLLTFDFEKHVYQYRGSVVPSVTQIITALLGTCWKAGDWYLNRGRAVHACAAFVGRGIQFKSDPQIAGQVRAVRRFFDDIQPEVIAVEKELYSELYRFAGTPDLICKIHGKKVIVDYKASIDKERTALQLGGYSVLTEGGMKVRINRGYGVQIREDGTYRMTEPINLRRSRGEFLALRTTYGIKERMNLLQNGA